MAALSRRVSPVAMVGMVVQPATILGWHRALVRKKWAAYSRRRGPGRPRLEVEIRKLILTIANENPK
jgi:putative transposase